MKDTAPPDKHLTVYPKDPICELGAIRAGLVTIAAACLADREQIPCDVRDFAEAILVIRDRLVDLEQRLVDQYEERARRSLADGEIPARLRRSDEVVDRRINERACP